jgi:hypothetical protein
MALNLSLPATGVTKHRDFYKVMRDNFDGLNTKLTPVKYDIPVLSGITHTTPMRYYVDYYNIVYLFGLISKAAGYSTLGQLWNPHFPSSNLLFMGRYAPIGAGLTQPIAISSTGLITCPYDLSSTITIYLDGIVFPIG